MSSGPELDGSLPRIDDTSIPQPWCPVECGCRDPKSSSSWAAQVQCPPPPPHSATRRGRGTRHVLNQVPCEDGNASQFSTEEGAAALNLHFETFRRSFADNLREQLMSRFVGHGSHFLSSAPELSGSPYLVRACVSRCVQVCG